MTYWFRSRVAADNRSPDTIPGWLWRPLLVRTILWIVALGAMAAFLAAVVFWPVLVWIVVIAWPSLAITIGLVVAAVAWLNYRDLIALRQSGRRLPFGPAILSLVPVIGLFVDQTFFQTHYTILRLHGIYFGADIGVYTCLPAALIFLIRCPFMRDRQRALRLAGQFLLIATICGLAPVVLIQEKDAIHFLLARPVYGLQLAHMPPEDAQLHIWDWGRIDAVVLNTEKTSLVFDTADQIALPESQRNPSWLARCRSLSDLCPPGPHDDSRVQRLSGHYYLVVTPY